MKSFYILIVFLALISPFPPESMEMQLANLQIEKAALLTRYRSENPQIQAIESEISRLSKTPDIFNKTYYDFLRGELTRLKDDRDVLRKTFRDKKPEVVAINAQISFIENALKGNAAKKDPGANP